jgi:hypothetical protein
LPLFLFRLTLQSASLALGQIWVNKTRSILTTLGIIIGVASVSAVIAAMEGMNRKILENFEMFGTRKIFIWPEQPRSGRQKNAQFWQLRFEAKHFEGLLENCPSVEYISLIANAGRFPGRFMDRTVDSVSLTGVDASWFKIENRPIVFGVPFPCLTNVRAVMSASLPHSFVTSCKWIATARDRSSSSAPIHFWLQAWWKTGPLRE